VGSGGFGKVRSAHFISNPDMKYAIKSIPMEKVNQNFDLYQNEIEISIGCDHQNLINFFEMYKDDRFLHLVMEQADGGDICDKIMAESKFTEQQAKIIIYDALKGLNFLH
jgi:serine/threonine protein kinase